MKNITESNVIQFFLVTDSECKFLDASVGYPGSVHDAKIFCQRELFRQISAGDIMKGT